MEGDAVDRELIRAACRAMVTPWPWAIAVALWALAVLVLG